jgi:Arc/MetJ-type ribon-helix-helix transcriptional regulator
MVQAQFSLDESSWAFVQRSEHYGFQSRDEVVRLALDKLQQELTQLELSAELYAEEYTADGDLRALTDSAIV